MVSWSVTKPVWLCVYVCVCACVYAHACAREGGGEHRPQLMSSDTLPELA